MSHANMTHNQLMQYKENNPLRIEIMKTTVQALLSVLVGRDPNEVVMIENNELRVVSTVNLLGDTQPMGGFQAQLQAAVRPLVPTTKPTADVPSPDTRPRGRPRKDPNAPTMKYSPKPPAGVANNNKRAWKDSDLKTMADLRANGASFEDIGKVFGRTGCAVRCQLQYLRNPKAPAQPVSRSVALM